VGVPKSRIKEKAQIR
jgi:hypothetical protein